MPDGNIWPANFTGVLAAQIPEVWPMVRDRIASACARGLPKYEADDIRQSIAARDMQLWVRSFGTEIDAVFVTEIVNYPRSKVCRVLIGTGTEPHEMASFILSVERWARAEGCASVGAIARPGWEKFLKPLGYDKTHVLLEKAI